jgi:hypothetical protein
MIYNYKITWVQPYYGWAEWRLQEIEKQLSRGNFPEANLVIAKAMAS